VAVLVGIVVYSQLGKAGKTTGGSAAKGASLPPPGVAVNAVAAKQGDIGVYLTGLGAVTPIHTVTVKSRVDGELMQAITRKARPLKRANSWRKSIPGPIRRN